VRQEVLEETVITALCEYYERRSQEDEKLIAFSRSLPSALREGLLSTRQQAMRGCLKIAQVKSDEQLVVLEAYRVPTVDGLNGDADSVAAPWRSPLPSGQT
jgi:hypothetical protein